MLNSPQQNACQPNKKKRQIQIIAILNCQSNTNLREPLKKNNLIDKITEIISNNDNIELKMETWTRSESKSQSEEDEGTRNEIGTSPRLKINNGTKRGKP